jgi:hypothetical protein
MDDTDHPHFSRFSAELVLYATTLLAMKRVRPDLIGEFKDKIILLQQKKPLRGPAKGVLQKMFDEALAV